VNIFALDDDPRIAASYHNNSHVVKMILESTQLLSTNLNVFKPKAVPCYKPTHINHPCSKWVRESNFNYIWLTELAYGLCDEYTIRYDKIHACQKLLRGLKIDKYISEVRWMITPFAQAMPDEYKDLNPVLAYRNYYMGAKSHLAKWKTSPPAWWKNVDNSKK
jgi:hypothetical protein